MRARDRGAGGLCTKVVDNFVGSVSLKRQNSTDTGRCLGLPQKQAVFKNPMKSNI
jgi:hypothetical protein